MVLRTWNPKRRALSPALAGFAASLITGCFTQQEDKQAGVDDFPNSIYARIEGHLGEAEKTETSVVPAAALAVLETKASVSVNAGSPKRAALLKRAASEDSTGFGAGLPIFTSSKKTDSTLEIDTAYFTAGVNWLDPTIWATQLVGAKHFEINASGDTTLVLSRDGDGDGLLLQPQDSFHISLRIEKRGKDGLLEIADLITDGGKDGDFKTEPDNRIYQARWFRLSGADTLSSAVYSDADSDGVVIDNAAPSLVDLVFFERDPKDKPEVADRTLSVRLLARYKQEPQEMRRFAAIEHGRDGRVNKIAFQNPDGGADIDPQGKTLVRMSVENTPKTDSVQSMIAETLLKPETLLGRDRDSLFRYDVRIRKQLGEEDSLRFSFAADRAVPPKSEPRDGHVSFYIAYRDGTHVLAEGDLKVGALSLRMTARDGKVYDATWNAQGHLLRLKVTASTQ